MIEVCFSVGIKINFALTTVIFLTQVVIYTWSSTNYSSGYFFKQRAFMVTQT